MVAVQSIEGHPFEFTTPSGVRPFHCKLKIKASLQLEASSHKEAHELEKYNALVEEALQI